MPQKENEKNIKKNTQNLKDKLFERYHNRGRETYGAKILDLASNLLIILLSFDTERSNMESLATLIN